MLRCSFIGLLGVSGCLSTSSTPAASPASPTAPVDASAVATMYFYNRATTQGKEFLRDDSLTLPATVHVNAQLTTDLDGRTSFLIRRDGQSVATVTAEPDPSFDASRGDTIASVSIDQVGTYTAELLVDGKPIGAQRAALAVASVPCVGGKRIMQARPVPPVHVAGDFLYVSRWRALDDVAPYVIEWRHDGKLVTAEASYPSRAENLRDEVERVESDLMEGETHARCAWDVVDEVYQLPFPGASWKPSAAIVVDRKMDVRLDEKHDPIAPGHWTAHIAVRGEETIDVAFTVNDAHEVVGLEVRPGEGAAQDAGKLQRARKPAHEQPDYVLVPVSPMELRALTRSLEAVHLREKINELSVATHLTLDASDVYRRNDLSPEQKYRLIQQYKREIGQEDAAENAQKRAQVMQAARKLKKLVAQYGGPWKPDERPANHSSMLY